jgi:hypothetical protein
VEERERAASTVRPVEFELFETIVCDSPGCHARCVCPSRVCQQSTRIATRSRSADWARSSHHRGPRAPCPDRCWRSHPAYACTCGGGCASVIVWCSMKRQAVVSVTPPSGPRGPAGALRRWKKLEGITSSTPRRGRCVRGCCAVSPERCLDKFRVSRLSESLVLSVCASRCDFVCSVCGVCCEREASAVSRHAAPGLRGGRRAAHPREGAGVGWNRFGSWSEVCQTALSCWVGITRGRADAAQGEGERRVSVVHGCESAHSGFDPTRCTNRKSVVSSEREREA